MGSKERDRLYHHAKGVGGSDKSTDLGESLAQNWLQQAYEQGRDELVHELWTRLLQAGVTNENWNGGDVVEVLDSFLQEHGIETKSVYCPLCDEAIAENAVREHYAAEHPNDDPVADGLVDPEFTCAHCGMGIVLIREPGMDEPGEWFAPAQEFHGVVTHPGGGYTCKASAEGVHEPYNGDPEGE